MITTVIARIHAVDRAGAGKNWLLAGLVAGTVVITGIGDWLSAGLLDIAALRQVYGVTLVAVLGYAALLSQLPAMRAHPGHQRPGRPLAIVLNLTLFSITMTLLGGSLVSPLPGAWINVDSHTIAVALALYTAFTLSLLRDPAVAMPRSPVISGSPGSVIGRRLLPAVTIMALAASMYSAEMMGRTGVTALIILAGSMAILDMRRLARGCTASGHLAEPAPETEAGFAAIARAARHLGTGACRICMVLGALLVTSAAWPLLTGTGATRIVGGLGAALALVPFAAACLLAELAGTPPVSSRSA